MLTLKAEASAGISLRDDMLPDMLDLARRTGCRIEVQGNETTFWAMPDDTLAGLVEAFDRLYPASWLVATSLKSAVVSPAPRAPCSVHMDVGTVQRIMGRHSV
jgi:hypothetical protein